MFSLIKCEINDAVCGYHLMMWLTELLYVMCTYDEYKFLTENKWLWWCGLIDGCVEMLVINVYFAKY